MKYTIKLYGANRALLMEYHNHQQGLTASKVGLEVDRYLSAMPHTNVERIEIELLPLER